MTGVLAWWGSSWLTDGLPLPVSSTGRGGGGREGEGEGLCDAFLKKKR